MSMFELYLFTRLDFLNGLFMFVMIVSVLLTLIFFVARLLAASDIDDNEELSKTIKITALVGAISVLSTLIIPTQKDVALIIGLHELTNNAEAKKLPDSLLKTVNSYLEELQKTGPMEVKE